MRSHSSVLRLAVLLFALALVGAQLHFCADFAPGNSGSHVCQVCATIGHAAITQALITEAAPAICRLESSFSPVEIPSLANGDIDVDALKQAVGPRTAGIMLTNPSTLGVFERR